MPSFTGNDSDGVNVTADYQNWFTLQNRTLSHSSDAFNFGAYSYASYTIMGNVISDADAVVSEAAAERNKVTIAATGFVYGDSDGIELVGSHHQVINNGEIHGGGDAAVQFLNTGGLTRGSLQNSGTIHGAFRGVALQDGDTVTNTGRISGAVSGVDILSGGTRILNHGEIIADETAILLRDSPYDAVNTISNHGLISTLGVAFGNLAIDAGSARGAVKVINQGEINGNVTLSLGDDVFDAAGGTLNGSLQGGSGDDTLILARSNPGVLMDFDGGDDSDTLDLSQFSSAVWVGLDYAGVEAWTRDDMTLTTNGWRTIADLKNVENVVGTIGIDYLAGNAADNVLGYVGASQIAGVDRMFGMGGQDTADFSRFGSAVWINLSATGPTTWTQDDANATDAPTASNPWRKIAQLSSIENLVGTKAIDYLHGDAGDNVFGYVGTSEILGIEEINGMGGNDTVDFSRFGSAVWVDLNFGPVEAYTQDDADATNAIGTFRKIADLTSIENVTGTAGSDLIRGTNGANVIRGGGGDDELEGRGGADTFVFASTPEDSSSHTVIKDFDANDAEKIDLRDVSAIVDYSDLVANHLSDMGGSATISDSEGLLITLEGWSVANFGAGNPISEDDFIF